MIYLELFLGFLKVGCFSFGAYAAIPLIMDVVSSYGWIDEEMLAYMIGISESTPGPLMVNIATYVGASQAGVLGATLATIAVVLPAFVIVIVITAVLSKVISNRYVQATLGGLTSGVIGIILATGVWMVFTNLFVDAGSAVNIMDGKAAGSSELLQSFVASIDIRAVIITAVLGLIYYGRKYLLKKRFSPILLILISAGLGMAVYAI